MPGQSGAGRTREQTGGGSGSGADTALVPYESVYGQYRDAALSQADRQLIPERLRALVQQYFQETPP